MTRVLFLLAGLIIGVAEAFAAKPMVNDVRIGVHPDKTRVVIEMSEQPRYRVFTLADPYRVVVDLPEVAWPEGRAWVPRPKGAITALRYGLFTPGLSRVVLDLPRPLEIDSIFVLPPKGPIGHRLVLDLAESTRPAFLAASRNVPIESAKPLRATPVAMLMAPPPAKSDERPTVVIDPGHGGVDPGAISLSGNYEKTLVLAYARALRTALEKSGRYRVVLTRDDDRAIPLRHRIAISERAGGDLFISIHANTHPSAKVRGASIYTLSENASDKEAAALAAKENKADVIAGVDLSGNTEVVSQILIDLAQRETMNLSKAFANHMVEEIGQSATLLANSHRSAGFAVLKSPAVPSVLLEVGHLSNRSEENQLHSRKHREKIVAAIVTAIDRYFELQQTARRR